MAQYEHLPIYKKAFELKVYLEKAARNFSRYNKYTHGTDLRNYSRDALVLIVRANNRRDKVPVLLELRETLELLKMTLQLCKELEVFANFNTFKVAINLAIDISRQNEGWLKALSGK